MSTTQRMESLTQHRQVLRQTFKEAKQRILIVSPLVSSAALRADDICELVHEATARGVRVMIYTDCDLNKDKEGFFNRTAAEGIASLHVAGAIVVLVKGIHNKTLAMDKGLIAEGSFNWLSAVRTAGGDQQREERTIVVEGEEAAVMIEKEVSSLAKMAVVATAEDVVSALSSADGKKKPVETKPEYLSLWIPFILFILGFATATISPICLLFFGTGTWALIHRATQSANWAYNQPDDNPGKPAYEPTEVEVDADFVDVYYTVDIRSKSLGGGPNYGDE